MKMYILVLRGIPRGYAINSAAHGSLQCHLEFADRKWNGSTSEFETSPQRKNYQEWLTSSFKKVVCKVSEEELAAAKEAGSYIETTENALGDKLVAVTFCPRKDEEWPECFSTFKKW